MGQKFIFLVLACLLSREAFAVTTPLYFRIQSAGNISLTTVFPSETCNCPASVGCGTITHGDVDGLCNNQRVSDDSSPVRTFSYTLPEAWTKDPLVNETDFTYYASGASGGALNQPKIKVTYLINDGSSNWYSEVMGTPCFCGVGAGISSCTFGGGVKQASGNTPWEFKKGGTNISAALAPTTSLAPPDLPTTLPAGSVVQVEVWGAEGIGDSYFWSGKVSSSSYVSSISIPYALGNFDVFGTVTPKYAQMNSVISVNYQMRTSGTAPDITKLEIDIPGFIGGSTDFIDSVVWGSCDWPGGAVPTITQATSNSVGKISVDFTSPVLPGSTVNITFTCTTPVSAIQNIRWDGKIYAGAAVYSLTGENPDDLYMAAFEQPPVPTGLAVVPANTQAGGGQLQVSWAVGGSAGGYPGLAVSTYEVFRSTYYLVSVPPAGTSSQGLSTAIGTPWRPSTRFVQKTPTPTVNDTGLTNTACYCYTVRAANPVGLSGFSAEVCGTPYAAPGTPRSLTVRVADQAAGLSWATAYVGSYDVAGYEVWRTTCATCSWSMAANLADPTASAWADSGLSNGAQVSYYVRAYDVQAHYGGNSTVISGYPAMNPPTGLVSAYDYTLKAIALQWTAPPAYQSEFPLAGYNIYRASCSACLFSLQGVAPTAGAAATIYLDSDITTAGIHRYMVASLSTQMVPGPMTSAVKTMVPPETPGGLTVLSRPSATLYLEWSPNNIPGKVNGYLIYRSTLPAQSWNIAGTAGQWATAYLDTQLTWGMRYYYSAAAWSQWGADYAQSLPTPEYEKEVEPSHIYMVGELAGDRNVTLAWGALHPVQVVSMYQIYRSTTNSVSTTVLVASQDATAGFFNSYNDDKVTNGLCYYYWVSAKNAGGEGDLTAFQSVTPFIASSTPLYLSALSAPMGVNLVWAESIPGTYGLKGYEVVKSDTPGGTATSTEIAWINVGVTTKLWNSPALTNGTTYYFAVRSVDWDGNKSALTAERAVAPANPPCAPSAPSAASATGWVELNWNQVNPLACAPAPNGTFPLSGYALFRSTTSSGPYVSLAVLPGVASTAYFDTQVTLGTTYYYKVMSYDDRPVGNVTLEDPMRGFPYVTIVDATPRVPASAPGGLVVDAGPFVHDLQVKLNWTPSVEGTLPVLGYNVLRSTEIGAPETATFRSGVATATYLDTSVINGRFYYYRVVPVEEKYLEGDWAAVTATPYRDPNVVTGLNAVPMDTAVAVQWTAPVMTTFPVASYQVYRATWPGTFGLTDLGNIAAPATVFVDSGPLVNGKVYYYHLRTWDTELHLSYSYSAELSATPYALPAAPTGLSLTSGPSRITLKWSVPAAGTYPVSGYRIYRALAEFAPGGGSLLATVPTALNYVDNTAVNGTDYWYSVAAYDAVSILHRGPFSSTQMIQAGMYDPPSIPVNLTRLAGAAPVTLTWDASTKGTGALSGYAVYRATYTGMAALGAEFYATTWVQAGQTYTDLGATAGMVYYYALRSRDDSDPGVWSPESDELRVFQGTAPSTYDYGSPQAGTIRLIWNALGDPAVPEARAVTGYYVYRSLNPSTGFTRIGEGQILGGGDCCTASAYDDSTVTTGMTMYYRVSAVYGDAYGNWEGPWNSVAWSATAAGNPSLPVVTVTATDTGALVTWTAATSPISAVTHYSIYRTTFTGVDTTVETPIRVSYPSLSYLDMALTNGNLYYYVIAAFDGGTPTPGSTTSYEAVTLPLGRPRALSAVPGDNYASLSWVPAPSGTAGIDGYSIERSLDGTNFTVAGTASGPAASTFGDSAIFNHIQYTYRVRAYSSGSLTWYSPYSNTAQVTPNIPHSPPASPLTVAGSGTVLVLWSAPSTQGPTNPVSGYRIYRATCGTCPYSFQSQKAGTVTWYLDSMLTNGTWYYYRLTALDAGTPPIEGAPATVFGIPFTAPDPPTALTVQVGNGTIQLGWAAAAATAGGFPVTRYLIYRTLVSNGTPATLINGVGTPATTYTDTSLVNGTRYYYKIRTLDTAVHQSVTSMEVSGVPFARPNDPLGLTVLGGNLLLILEWQSATAGTYSVAGYNVYIGDNAGSATTMLTSTAAGALSCTAPVFANGTYYVNIRPFDAQGNESSSGYEQAVTTAAATVNPPVGVAAQGGNQEVWVTWGAAYDPGPYLDGYNVWRSTCTTCAYVQQGATLPMTATGYLDASVGNSTLVRYVVRSVDGAVECADYPSLNMAQATPFAPPGAPTNLAATAGMGAVELSWAAPASGGSAGISRYVVLRGSPNCPCSTTMALLGASAVGYTDWTVVNGVTYRYEVRALAWVDGDYAPGPGAQTALVTPNMRPTESHLALNAFAPARGGRLAITYTLDAASDVKVKIFSMTGIKVWEFEQKNVPAGPALGEYQVVGPDLLPGWDGRASDGLFVSSGVYLVRLEMGGKTKTLKVIVVK